MKVSHLLIRNERAGKASRMCSSWGQMVALEPSALAIGGSLFLLAGSLLQRIDKMPLLLKADCPDKISPWHCLLLLLWMCEEKGRVGAGKGRPGVNWSLLFLKSFKDTVPTLLLTAGPARDMWIPAALFCLLLVQLSCSHLVHWTYKGNEKRGCLGTAPDC